MSRTPTEVAAAVSEVFRGVFDQLAAWRAPIEQLLVASASGVGAAGGTGSGAASAVSVRPFAAEKPPLPRQKVVCVTVASDSPLALSTSCLS